MWYPQVDRATHLQYHSSSGEPWAREPNSNIAKPEIGAGLGVFLHAETTPTVKGNGHDQNVSDFQLAKCLIT